MSMFANLQSLNETCLIRTSGFDSMIFLLISIKWNLQAKASVARFCALLSNTLIACEKFALDLALRD